MPRKILVVDDVEINRQVLRKMLADEYEVLEAENGQKALDILREQGNAVSLVLLDVIMPVMDGYEVLAEMRGERELSSIPVIVTTGSSDVGAEVKCLAMGANDYVLKPYNPAVIKHRVRNTINLLESAAFVNSVTRDTLTGLYNRETFFVKAAELIAAHESGYYVMACFDVENFKVINDQYGGEAGDRVLCHLADTFREGFEKVGGICCRVTADNFAVLYPASFMESEEIAELRARASEPAGILQPISFSIGRYIVDDTSLRVSAMYDRASLAELSVKGRYDVNIGVYDESMRESLLHEQRIVDEMNGALAGGEFEVWYQPQYNHGTGAIVGAEALVRWRHPKKGLIPPGEFIPVFERNGFIYELDKFVWERVCQDMRRWIDGGRRPLPVSMNVSRYDVFRADFFEVLTGLIKKYDLPVALLRLEITESAFASSTELIVAMVRRLIDFGFAIEIDDFGSGYSSLNTLKDVPANILKLDMRFLETGGNSQRGGSILESIVRMARWLDMPVIAEGVETKAQADFLLSVGCAYVQGYLYARPMPVCEYEALAHGSHKEQEMQAMESLETLNSGTFWDPGSMDTLIFNSFVGGAFIFEYHNGAVELLRVNYKFIKMLGGDVNMTQTEALRINWVEHIDTKSRAALREVMRLAMHTGEEVTGDALLRDVPGIKGELYLRCYMQPIARSGERHLFYATIENLTAQHEAERYSSETSQRIQAIMENMTSGITAVTLSDKKINFIFANKRYYEMLGYTPRQYADEVRSTLSVIHEEDRAEFLRRIEQVVWTGETDKIECRVIKRNGETLWIRHDVALTRFLGVEEPVLIGVSNDISARKEAERRTNMVSSQLQAILANVNSGVSATTMEKETLRYVFANEWYYGMLGYTRGQFESENKNGMIDRIFPEDRDKVFAAVRDTESTLRTNTVEYRAYKRDGSLIWIRSIGSSCRIEGLSAPVNLAISSDVTKEKEAELSLRNMVPVALAAMMDSSRDLTFVKDRDMRYICCSRAFAKLAGVERAEELTGKRDRELLTSDVAEQYEAVDREILKTGKPAMDCTTLLPGEGGHLRYSNISKYPLYDPRGNVIGIYGIGRDTTEAREAYSRLKLLTDSIPGGIATYAYDGKELHVVYFNDGFCELLGYTREEYERLSAVSPVSKVDEEDLHLIRDYLSALLRGDSPEDCIYRVHTKSGDIKWINLRGAPAERYGDTLHINAVLYDVTRQVAYEEKLRINDEEIRLALSQMGKLILLYDVPTRTLTMPEAYAERHGFRCVMADFPECIHGRGVIESGEWSGFIKFFEAILRGDKTGEVESRLILADGSYRWERAEFAVVYGSDGKSAKAVIAVEDTTERHDAEAENEQHRQSEQVLKIVAAHSNRIIYRYDIATGTASVNSETGGDMDPIPMETNVPESTIESGRVLPESAEDFRQVFRDIASGVPSGGIKAHMKKANGELCWADVQYSVIFDESGRPKSAVISFLDVSENHEKELAYERYLQRLNDDSVKGRIVYFESDLTADTVERVGGDIADVSFPKAGCTHLKAVSYGVDNLLERSVRDEARAFFSRQHLITAFSDGERSLEADWPAVLPKEGKRWFRSEIQMIDDPYSGHVRAYISLLDITEEKLAAMDVQKQAETDGMTGLYNKVTTEERSSRILARGDGTPCALLVADLDGLKSINDNLGHAQGDRAIKSFAELLKAQFRATDVVGRVGGDEFVVFLDGGGNEARVRSQLATFMRKLSRVRVGERDETVLHGSVGAALGKAGEDSYGELFRRADRALYQIKRSGKNNFAFYVPDMELDAYKHGGRGEQPPWATTFFDTEELNHLLNAVSAIYPLVISVNLTQNSYYMMQYGEYTTKSAFASGVFDELIEEGSLSFHPEDRESFIRAFSRKNLLDANERGERTVSHQGRQLGDDGIYRHIRTDVIFVRNSSRGDVLEITLAREVDEHRDN